METYTIMIRHIKCIKNCHNLLIGLRAKRGLTLKTTFIDLKVSKLRMDTYITMIGRVHNLLIGLADSVGLTLKIIFLKNKVPQ